MRYLATLLAVSALGYAPRVLGDSQKCKCAPEDSCWPSDDDWEGLNKAVNGRLIQARPPASVCYESQSDYDRGACDDILKNWDQSALHADDPIGLSYPLWADNPCPPIFENGTSVGGDPKAGDKGCTLGKYPSYVVNATNQDDVVTAVKWAVEKNVRLNVKAAGHSLLGRSTAYGSLSIWTHNIKGVEFHDDFEPDSCVTGKRDKQMAATIAAGGNSEDVYSALGDHDAIIVAGTNPTVGAVGWFTGGGHGPLSTTYGMGSDNILQATVVLVNGTVVTANECTNPDLFWALRGGGGGTYGIVTSVVMKAYPTPKTTTWELAIILKDESKESQWWDLIAEFTKELKGLKDQGLQGGFVMTGSPSGVPLNIDCNFYLYDKEEGTVDKLFEPLKKKLDDLKDMVKYTSDEKNFNTWNEAYNGGKNEAVGTNLALGSWLIPAEGFEDTKAVAKVFKEVGPTLDPKKTGGFLKGAFVANSDNRNLDTALNPAWRDTLLHTSVAGVWEDGASDEEIKAVRDDVTNRQVAALKTLAPNSGAYFNEMDAFEPEWQSAAFGDNYSRLRDIKKTYDPEGVLWCHHCVGSEDWAEDDKGKLCTASDE